MVEAGLFRNERVELIEGVIVQMSPQSPPHAGAIQILNTLLNAALNGRAAVRVQSPFATGADGLPEPDIALVEPRPFWNAHPDRAFLIIEVADSSLRFDRHEKAEIYAQAGVPEYWVVNLAAETVECHTEPTGGDYSRVTTCRRDDVLRPVAFPDVGIRVAAIFGG